MAKRGMNLPEKTRIKAENAFAQMKKLPRPDPAQKYTLPMLILMFFAFSLIGWVWEVVLYFIENGVLVNKGTLTGPWLPIYGSGGALIILLFKKHHKRPVRIFFSSLILCTALEYVTSWAIEELHGVRYWDYSSYLINLNGRVCLEGAIMFGLAGCAGVYYLGPIFAGLYKKLRKPLVAVLCCVLIALFALDVVYSGTHPNSGAGINDYKSAEWVYQAEENIQENEKSLVLSNEVFHFSPAQMPNRIF